MATKKVKLPWKECECGCRGGSLLQIGKMEFTTEYFQKSEKPFWLNWGHVTGGFLASFKTMEERDAYILTMPSVIQEIKRVKDEAKALKAF